MNHPETVKLLALMSAMDRRTIGDAEVMAWQSVLDDVDFADAAEAVRRHYRDSGDYLMPVHVRRGAEAIAAERARPEPSPWAPGQHGVPKGQAHPELDGPIAEATRAIAQELLARLKQQLPKGSRAALRPRTVYWEQEHAAYRRQRDAEPNPYYRPRTLADAPRVCRGAVCNAEPCVLRDGGECG